MTGTGTQTQTQTTGVTTIALLVLCTGELKMELAKRIRECERRIEDNVDTLDGMLTASDVDSEATIDYDLSDSMMVEGIQKQQTEGVKLRNLDHEMRRRNKKAKNTKIRTLLSAIAGMF